MPCRMPNWKDPRERAEVGQADDELLQDADLGAALHHPHEAEKIAAPAHHAVGVEHDHVVEPLAVALQEVPKVAGLMAFVGRAAAVVEAIGTQGPRPPAPEQRLFRGGDLRHLGVAEQENLEPRGLAGVEAGDGVLEVADHPPRVLVVDRHDQRHPDADGPTAGLRRAGVTKPTRSRLP